MVKRPKSVEVRYEVRQARTYEVRPRKDKRGFDLISERLPFGRLWYEKAADAAAYVKFHSRSHDAIIRVFDESGAVIETHQHIGDFREAS